MDSPKRAWIYTRVAAPPDIDQAALEMQKKLLYDFAAQHGYTIVGYSGEHAGGLRLDRSGFNEVLSAADKGMFDVLLAKDVARITRRIVDWDYIQTTFEKLGVAVHTTDWGYFEPEASGFVQHLRSIGRQQDTEHENSVDDQYMDSQQM